MDRPITPPIQPANLPPHNLNLLLHPFTLLLNLIQMEPLQKQGPKTNPKHLRTELRG